MNIKEPKWSVEEENTQRIISRANRLGYIITSIKVEATRVEISIIPSQLAPYTPKLERDFRTGQWQVQTTAYGALNLDEIEKLTEGYGRAAAMVQELQSIKLGYVAEYHLND